jgi:ketosteroid isomerase-like protein
MRRLLTLGAVGALAVSLAACGGSSKSSAAEQLMQRQAELYQITEVEKTFHKAGSTHDVDLMMTLFAPGATFNIGTDTYTGKAQIRRFFATKNQAFQPQNHWLSETPEYKVRITLNGDKATLHFECHYVDVKTGKIMAVVGVDHNLQKIKGKWLIVSGTGAPATLAI